MLSSTASNITLNSQVPGKVKLRRGRKSTVPPEQREQIRRIKKQNMERKRRACISDKMNALHTLAMTLIGEDPSQYQKVEKADILNVCYQVFQNLVAIVKETPDIHLRVQQFGHQIRSKSSPESSAPSTPDIHKDKENFPPQQAINLLPGTSQYLSSYANTWMSPFSLVNPPQTNLSIQPVDLSQMTDSGVFNSDTSSNQENVQSTSEPIRDNLPPGWPCKQVLSTENQNKTANEYEARKSSLWRPYLD